MARKENKLNSNFVRTIIDSDIREKESLNIIKTRFPPEPNGYLHIGHAKSIFLNFQTAEFYSGICNLRFDDTNPAKEQVEYVNSIISDIKWLGVNLESEPLYTSDYFDDLYEYAVILIRKGKAYVDDLSFEDIRLYRGTLKKPGKESPFRDRSVKENLDIFDRMKLGEFKDGEKVLRAKIDMSHPNLTMRDPVLYRIRKMNHHRTGKRWCIYPMYDFAHCLSDSIEGVTHSLCTLEFENNKFLYEWLLDAVGVTHKPKQIEFARLNLGFTVLSKRKLKKLVNEGYVSAWDDPRMPTISGLRRRGYTPESIRGFCEKIGVAKRDSIVDIAMLEHCIREDLNLRAERVMAVLKPLKIVITNYPKNKVEFIDAINNPENAAAGMRKLPFSRVLYIEKDDFMEDPSKKFYRLAPGREVRLRYAFFIVCTDVIKDKITGEIVELHCMYDPKTLGGKARNGRKVKSTLHWVSAAHAIDAEVRLYDRLFTKYNPDNFFTKDGFKNCLNCNSIKILKYCKLEPSLANVQPGYYCQFERLGYFSIDYKDSRKGSIVFNRIVALRDQWVKMNSKKT